jgi:hypothetical protein
MRNDARRVGHESGHQSPVASRESTVNNHQSTVDDREPEAREEQLDEQREPALPANDATLKTKI